MKLLLCLLIIITALCDFSNAKAELFNVQIRDEQGHSCYTPKVEWGKLYNYCIHDGDRPGDHKYDGGSGYKPWCRREYTTGKASHDWGYCYQHDWFVRFPGSVISRKRNEYADKFYHFRDDYRYKQASYNSVSELCGHGNVANFKTQFTVVKNSESSTGYKVVVPEVFSQSSKSTERLIYEESMDNIREILATFKGRSDLNNWWVRDVNGNNREYCLSYNRRYHSITADRCHLPYEQAVLCEFKRH